MRSDSRFLAGLLGLVLLPGVAFPGAALAQSLFNAEGIGRWSEGQDVASRGAGGTAIGWIDPFASSALNPASAAWARSSTASIAVLGELTRQHSALGDDRTSDIEPTGLRFTLAAPSHIRVTAGYRSVTDAGYRSERSEVAPDGALFRRLREGRGGLGGFSAGVAWKGATDRVALGFEVGSLQGVLREVAEDDFESSLYVDSRNILRTRLENGHPWSIGTQLRPHPRLDIGLSYQGESELDARSLLTTSGGPTFEETAKMTLPSALGLGCTVHARPGLLVSVDWGVRRWADARLDVSGPAAPNPRFFGTSDSRHWGVGLRYSPRSEQPKDPILQRAVYRLGFSEREESVTDADGDGIPEWALSAGLGLPMQVDRGYLDLALEVGKRGDEDTIGLAETFVRLGVGVTFARLRPAF